MRNEKTFIVFLNYRNGCMQDYEDVLKRAPSCEMKNFQLFHCVS